MLVEAGAGLPTGMDGRGLCPDHLSDKGEMKISVHTKLPTWCTEYYLFVKYYYSPLHISSIKYPSSGGHRCT